MWPNLCRTFIPSAVQFASDSAIHTCSLTPVSASYNMEAGFILMDDISQIWFKIALALLLQIDLF